MLEKSPDKLSIQDSRISETDPLSTFELSLSPLGTPLEAKASRGPMESTLQFNPHAEPGQHDDGHVQRTYEHDHQEGAKTTRETKVGGETVTHQTHVPLDMEQQLDGTGELPHAFKIEWKPDHSVKVERAASGNSTTTWTLNPAGLVTKLAYPDGITRDYSYDQAGRITEAESSAGTLIWKHDPQTGRLVRGELSGQTLFHIQERDPVGRILRFEDDSGIREFTPDNTFWTLGHEEWTSGPLNGARIERTPDERGRPGALKVIYEGQVLQHVEYHYRGDSLHLDHVTVQAPSAPENTEIHYGGPAGRADRVEFREGNDLVFFQELLRDAFGHPEALSSGPGSPYNASWTLDPRGRMETMTRPEGTSTLGYDPHNGTLASISGPRGSRQFVVNDRGELAGVVIEGQTLDVQPDPNLSGTVVFRENRRRFDIHGQAHPDATVRVYLEPVPEGLTLTTTRRCDGKKSG